MSVQINHAIVIAYDKEIAAAFFARIFGLAQPIRRGRFTTVLLGDGAYLHFAEPRDGPEIQKQHIAFMVSDDHFDAIYERVLDDGIAHWADPWANLVGQINTNRGGRGFYFHDASGHHLEVLTRSDVD